MGFEYRLSFEHPSAAGVEKELSRVPGVTVRQFPDGRFEFRTKDAAGDMPDAEARVEPWGVYFCDYGGEGRRILGFLLANLVSAFGAVCVAELE